MALPRIGLALGSGAGRGWAHIGIIRALERAGVRFLRGNREGPGVRLRRVNGKA